MAFKIPLFVVLSFIATSFPGWLGNLLWPAESGIHASMFFWLASGMNLGLVLAWGKRYAPLILVNGLLAIILLHESIPVSIVGSLLNMFEVLLACWFLKSCQPIRDTLDQPTTVKSLCLVSLLMGLFSALPLSVIKFLVGEIPQQAVAETVVSIGMSNACAVMLLTPFIISLPQSLAFSKTAPFKFGLWIVLGFCLGLVAYDGVFRDSVNYAFLVFPLMIFVSINFPFRQIPVFLVVIMLSVYAALILHASELPVDQTEEVIWFVQAVTWTLATSSLLLDSLISENRRKSECVLRQERDLLEGQLRLEQANLETLRYQIHPHFLFNALNSISSTLPANETTPRKMIAALAAIFRSSLQKHEGNMASLSSEIDGVKEYLTIETLRFGDALQVHFEIDPQLKDVPFPLFVLQPLVENAIRYGFEMTEGDFVLCIRARPKDERSFVVEVENPGRWVENDKENTPGIGLENVEKRLSLIYKGEAEMQKIFTESHVCIRLTVSKSVHPDVGG